MATWKALLLFAAGTSAFQSSATRKTLNFSPLIQNSHFTTSPAQGHSPFATLETRSSVVELAEAYLKRVLHLPEGTWKPREDSYQDQATQIWHLYFRQLLQEGLVEVVDGDVNLNVLNGRVISYGDSFYRGPVPSLRNPSRYDNTTYDLSHYCRQLERLGAVHRLFTGHPHAHDLTQGLFTQAGFTQSSSEEDAYRYNTYCANQHRLLDAIQARFTQTSDVDPQVSNPVDAALYFILAAHPNIAEADAIAGNLDIHRQNTVTRHIAEDNIAHDPFDKLLFESPYPNLVRLSNLPLAISSIYASLVYVQTNQLVLPNPPAPNLDPDGLDLPTNTVLPLAWKLVVELPENHYKAYIDAYVPSRILKVVDWVSDFDHHPTGELERARHPWPGDGTCSLNPPRSENVISQRGVFKDASGPATGATAYKVWPLGINDPLDGEGLREVLRSPHDTLASPLGWHSIPARHNPNWDPELPLQPTGELPDVEWAWRTGHKEGDEGETCHFVETWGNNVQAQENWEGRGKFLRNHRPDGGPDSSNLMFNYSYGASSKHDGEDIDPHAYVDLAITQLFYVINAVHDLFYRYGFTEAAGNFQSYNFGKGGKEDDAVLAYAQDGSRTNNANFVTPPDGIQGKMRVYIWTHSVPFRDASLDTGIVVHELSHGLSRRLTGGPRNSRCLGTDEGAGLSEGWGDFTAVL
ncbi:Fungalysin/Thermolysin Extracellular metalloproteinase 5, partial [Tulasnella sp. 427]